MQMIPAMPVHLLDSVVCKQSRNSKMVSPLCIGRHSLLLRQKCAYMQQKMNSKILITTRRKHMQTKGALKRNASSMYHSKASSRIWATQIPTVPEARDVFVMARATDRCRSVELEDIRKLIPLLIISP